MTKRQRLAKAVKRMKLRFRGKRGGARLFFVFGAQRSGTTMTMWVFQRHPLVEAFFEGDDEAFDSIRLRQLTTIQKLTERAYGELLAIKPICDSQHAARILNAFPTSKAVWIYRDWRDVVNSSLRNFKQHTEFLRIMLEEPVLANWRAEQVTPEHVALVRDYYERGIDDASARSLIWYLRNALYFQQRLEDHSRIVLVKYENIVTRPKEFFEKLFDFAGLPNDRRATARVHSQSIRKNDPPTVEPEIAARCDTIFERLEQTRSRAAVQIA